jgi:hypothetical protein
MAFYIYRPADHDFLADDEHSFTEDIYAAAVFTSRKLAEEIADREFGEGHGAYILDDGAD